MPPLLFLAAFSAFSSAFWALALAAFALLAASDFCFSASFWAFAILSSFSLNCLAFCAFSFLSFTFLASLALFAFSLDFTSAFALFSVNFSAFCLASLDARSLSSLLANFASLLVNLSFSFAMPPLLFLASFSAFSSAFWALALAAFSLL